MSFTIITNSTTISATELNNNFYHIGQGDLLPMGSVSLTAESGQHDLGSNGNRWRTIYVNEIASTLTVSAPMTFNAPVTFNTTTSFPNGFLGYFPYIMAWEIYPTSTNAPAGTSGAYAPRALNTSASYNLAATLTSSQITLPPGTYELQAMGTGYAQTLFKTRFYNITDGTSTAIGDCSAAGSNGHGISLIFSQFQIVATSTFELQQRCSAAGIVGQGNSVAKGVFAYIHLTRLSA